MKEKAIENQILSFLKWLGFLCWKQETQGTYDPIKKIYRRKNSVHRMVGISDILAVDRMGRVIAIEVKSAKGRVSPDQKAFLERINQTNGIGFVARSVDDVERELKTRGLI